MIGHSGKHHLMGHIVGLGLHIGIDLVTDRKSGARAINEAGIIFCFQ